MTNYASTVYQSLDKDHEVIAGNVLPRKINEIPVQKKRSKTSLLYF